MGGLKDELGLGRKSEKLWPKTKLSLWRKTENLRLLKVGEGETTILGHRRWLKAELLFWREIKKLRPP